MTTRRDFLRVVLVTTTAPLLPFSQAAQRLPASRVIPEAARVTAAAAGTPIRLSTARYVKPGTYLYACVRAEPNEPVPSGEPGSLPSPEEMRWIALEQQHDAMLVRCFCCRGDRMLAINRADGVFHCFGCGVKGAGWNEMVQAAENRARTIT